MKAQATLELIISIGFLMLIFAIVALLALSKSTQSSELKSFLDAKRIGESVRDNINMISRQGHGYYKYFTIPEKIQGGYEYNLTVNKNILEITWGDSVWSAQLITADTQIHSLDKGKTKLNRVLNNHGRIEVTGHRPNLLPECKSLNFSSDGTTLNITINVINDAHVDNNNKTLTALTQLCPSAYTAMASTPEIKSSANVKVLLNYTIQCPSGNFSIKTDYLDEVLEGIESDNECNVTLY